MTRSSGWKWCTAQVMGAALAIVGVVLPAGAATTAVQPAAKTTPTASATATVAAEPYGSTERVQVVGTPSIEVQAVLDVKAASTLKAVDIKFFNRDAKTWVRFTIDNGSVLSGNRVSFERPVLRDIKRKQRDGGVEHRPEVEMTLCVGDQTIDAKLSLSDRTGYTAPLVIGANEVRKLGRIDVARKFTREPSCPPPTDGPVVIDPAGESPVQPNVKAATRPS